jgi:hypothetical protein
MNNPFEEAYLTAKAVTSLHRPLMVANGTYAWLSKIRDRLTNFLPPPQTGFARSVGRIAKRSVGKIASMAAVIGQPSRPYIG